MAKELSEETLKEAFESADKDKDSQISVSELGMYLQCLSKKLGFFAVYEAKWCIFKLK